MQTVRAVGAFCQTQGNKAGEGAKVGFRHVINGSKNVVVIAGLAAIIAGWASGKSNKEIVTGSITQLAPFAAPILGVVTVAYVGKMIFARMRAKKSLPAAAFPPATTTFAGKLSGIPARITSALLGTPAQRTTNRELAALRAITRAGGTEDGIATAKANQLAAALRDETGISFEVDKTAVPVPLTGRSTPPPQSNQGFFSLLFGLLTGR